MFLHTNDAGAVFVDVVDAPGYVYPAEEYVGEEGAEDVDKVESCS